MCFSLSLSLSLSGLQVAVKNNIDVFYFSCQFPISLLFVEDGKMGKCVSLCTINLCCVLSGISIRG